MFREVFSFLFVFEKHVGFILINKINSIYLITNVKTVITGKLSDHG